MVKWKEQKISQCSILAVTVGGMGLLPCVAVACLPRTERSEVGEFLPSSLTTAEFHFDHIIFR